MTRPRAVMLALLLLAAAPAEAALPPPPFAFDVTPAHVTPGQSALLRITPRGGPGEFDLYVMWALSPEAAFLTPDGAWSPRPVAFRTRVPAGAAPISARWSPGPPGEIPLALVVVPAGGDPMARFGWTFRPLLVRISAPAAAAPAPRDWSALAPVTIVTILACAVVMLADRRGRA
jgi:hypothetical protein